MSKKKTGALTNALQTNKTILKIKYVLIALCVIVAGIYFFKGMSTLLSPIPSYEFSGIETFTRVTDKGEEEYEDETVCPVEFESEDGSVTMTVNYSFD